MYYYIIIIMNIQIDVTIDISTPKISIGANKDDHD